MCGECQSLEWDAVQACGRGTICSFTILTHPQFPGYEYPLIIVLVVSFVALGIQRDRYRPPGPVHRRR